MPKQTSKYADPATVVPSDFNPQEPEHKPPVERKDDTPASAGNEQNGLMPALNVAQPDNGLSAGSEGDMPPNGELPPPKPQPVSAWAKQAETKGSHDVTEHYDTDANRPASRSGEDAVPVDGGSKDTIGLPELFLERKFKEQRNDVRIVSVKSNDGATSYVITRRSPGSNLPDIGFFELSEGMDREAAEKAVTGAFDSSAIVV